MLTRRQFLGSVAGLGALGLASGGYAVGFEPMRQPVITTYRLTPPNWPAGLRLRIVALADIHACRPWMDADRIRSIVDVANGLGGDMIVLLGDYVIGIRHVAEPLAPAAWLQPLTRLSAPLGVHAVMGNHDWWEDMDAQRERLPETFLHRMMRDHGIPVYSNTAQRLEKDGHGLWIAGLEDQRALRQAVPGRSFDMTSLADVPKTMAAITDDAPVVMMAHEPDIFAHMPDRVALTLCGHTHGGQVQMFNYAPFVPSAYGQRYRYGHIVEEGKNLIVSGGLGCTGLPLRVGMPPEIVVVELG
ncbi:hypothetical protein SAMN05880582_1011656 [Rhizobium sp. RU20A]|uniref:metallophosphoesterase n=1 Tax=Rhizobium sp. RU20A TaxID=1907412 RepID=UPI000955F27F|nr:metallophosphoesterase [Rhizobium sp. RU20A]SIQ37922.1 hypothetical protein SAMN05880582_1011656 [Rhizobium sp. RU20A]